MSGITHVMCIQKESLVIFNLAEVSEEELEYCQLLRYCEKIDKLEKRKESENITDFFENLCNKKRGLSREYLLQDILASFMELKRKGYIDNEYNCELHFDEKHVTELSIEIRTRKI